MGSHSLLQGNLPDPGMEPGSPALAGRFFPTELPGKPFKARGRMLTGPGTLNSCSETGLPTHGLLLLPHLLPSFCTNLENSQPPASCPHHRPSGVLLTGQPWREALRDTTAAMSSCSGAASCAPLPCPAHQRSVMKSGQPLPKQGPSTPLGFTGHVGLSHRPTVGGGLCPPGRTSP